MKVDAFLLTSDLATVGERAGRMEALGYDGLYTAETQHDPFLPLVPAAERTDRIDLGTAIAVAFPRSPVHLAHIGHDLQAFSQGRFILGLGSQVKAHIEKRFSASFSSPAARMREAILAIRAVWDAWENGTPLRFEGEFYRHTLMTPFFSPEPSGYGAPRVFLAAVGERMTEVAGEVADGMFVHVLTTPKYLAEVTLPALERGLARSGRSRADVELSLPVFLITGDDDDEQDRAATKVRGQLAFYASTPAYRGVLDAHGWGQIGEELTRLSKRGAWEEMARCVPDDMLDAFSVAGTTEEMAASIEERYSGAVDRLAFYTPSRPDPEDWSELVAAIKARAGRSAT